MNKSPTPVLFVGGPEDGKHVNLRNMMPTIEVAALPRLPTYVDSDDTIDVEVRRYRYRVERFFGDIYVAYPEDWMNDPTRSPFEKVMTALTRGYVGRA